MGRRPDGIGDRRKLRSFWTWNQMIQRCTNPNNPRWKDYGGRGITVCDRWRSFANFLADMGERPPTLQLERKENDGGYEPSNCVWADRKTQMNNRRNSQPPRQKMTQHEARLVGAAASAATRNARSKAAADKIRERWGAEGYTATQLVAETGYTYHTMKRWLGKWEPARKRRERNAKRAALKERADAE